MVLGIGEGRIDITTERFSYGPGEEVRGRVILQLNKPKSARALRIRFYGEKRTFSYSSSGKKSVKTEQIFSQERILGGHKEYPEGISEYQFQFRIPIVAELRDTGSIFKWYLDASLDLPLSFDISKRQVLNFTLR